MVRLNYRYQRINSQLQRELSKLLHFEVKDPRLNEVTITEVSVVRDLSLAKILFIISDAKQLVQVEKALKQANGFLRRRLAELLDLRRMPELSFYYDKSFIKAERLTNLLKQAD